MVQRHCWQVDSLRRERRQRDGEGGNLSVEGRITWGNVLKKYTVETMNMYSPTYCGWKKSCTSWELLGTVEHCK